MEQPHKGRHAFSYALPIMIPMGISFFFIGLGFGLYATSQGFPWWVPPVLGIVIFAGFFAELERRNKLKDPIWSVLVPLAIGGFVAGIIFFMQNHLSAAILVITTLLTQMFIAGINFKAFITLMISGLIGSYFVIQSIFKKASRTDLDRQE